MNKKITDLKIMFKDYLTMFSMHSSLRCVKMVTIRFLIVPVLTAFILLQGCRTTSDISAGESQQEKNRKSEEAVLASSSEDSSSLSGKTIEKDSQREEKTGKENKDMELKSLYLELLGTEFAVQVEHDVFAGDGFGHLGGEDGLAGVGGGDNDRAFSFDQEVVEVALGVGLLQSIVHPLIGGLDGHDADFVGGAAGLVGLGVDSGDGVCYFLGLTHCWSSCGLGGSSSSRKWEPWS